MNNIIIGITGTLGAGKGTIVEYLKSKKGFNHYSAREFIVREINKRGLESNRDNMVMVANELRANNSPSYIAESLYQEAIEKGGSAVIESLRTVGEIEALRAKGSFYLFAVEAEAKTRYSRIHLRNSVTDNVDYNTFVVNEKREMTTDDPNKQNLSKCIAMADYVFDNNGTIIELERQVDDVIDKINNI